MKRYLTFALLAGFFVWLPNAFADSNGVLSIDAPSQVRQVQPNGQSGADRALLTLNVNNIQVRASWRVTNAVDAFIIDKDNGKLSLLPSAPEAGDLVATVYVEDQFNLLNEAYTNLTAMAVISVEIISGLRLAPLPWLTVVAGEVVHTLEVDGAEGDKTYEVAGGNDYFVLDKTSDILSVLVSAEARSYTLTLKVMDDTFTVQALATVDVSAALTMAATPPLTVVASVAMSVHTFKASGGIGVKTYTLVAGGDNYFSVNATSGVLSVQAKTPAKLYVLTVRALDVGNRTVDGLATVGVSAMLTMAEAPSFTVIASVAMSLHTFKASGGIGVKTYTLVSDDDNYFSVNATSGVLSVQVNTPATLYVVTVRALDARNNTIDTSATVGVSAMLTMPPVGEQINQAKGGTVSLYTFVASGGVGAKTYTMVAGNDEGYFSLGSSSGVLSLVGAATVGMYTLAVEAMDRWDNVVTAVATVRILLLYLADAKPLSVVVGHAVSLHTFVADGGAGDNTYTLMAGDGHFTLGEKSGVLSVLSSAPIKTYTLVVEVNDGEDNTAQATAVVEVVASLSLVAVPRLTAVAEQATTLYTLAATGGIGAKTYTLVADNADYFAVTRAGILSGTANKGFYTVTLAVLDEDDNRATAVATVEVSAVLRLAEVPSLTIVASMAMRVYTFEASGGLGVKTYTLVSGGKGYFGVGEDGALSVVGAAVGSYTLSVVVNDRVNNKAATVAVVEVVSPLSLATVPRLTVIEKKEVNLYTLMASGGIGAKTYTLVAGNTEHFGVAGESGVLSVNAEAGRYTLTLGVIDARGNTVTAWATVDVSVAMMMGDAPALTVIATVAVSLHTFTAHNGIGVKTYTLLAHDEHFMVAEASGILSVMVGATVGLHTLTIRARDEHGNTIDGLATVGISAVLSLADAPLLRYAQEKTVDLHTFAADGGIGRKTYTLMMSDAAGHFRLDVTTGVLSSRGSASVGVYTLSVQVSDGRGHLAFAVATVQAMSLYLAHAPWLYAFVVGSDVSLYTFTAEGGSGDNSYTIIAGNDDYFVVNMSTGVLSVRSAVTEGIYTLSIQAIDGHNQAVAMATAVVEVALPLLLSPSAALWLTAIAEPAASAELYHFMSSGGVGARTYKLLAGNEQGYFAIDAASGWLSLVNEAEVGSTHTLSVAVEDAAQPPHRVVVAVAVQVVRNKIFVLGGRGNSRLNDVWSSWSGHGWALDQKNESTTVSWTQRNSHQVVVHNERLYLLGGYQGGYKNDVWSSLDGRNWLLVPTDGPKWSGRDEFQAVSHGGRFYVLGGRTSSGYANDVWSSVDGISWVTVKVNDESERWSSRRGHQAVSHNGRLYVLGGDDSGGKELNDVWSSVDGTSWSLEKVNNGSVGWLPRKYHQAVSHHGRLYVMGGNKGTGSNRELNDVWFSVDGKSWAQETGSTWPEREYHQVVSYRGTMYVLGGRDGEGPRNDIWSSSDGNSWESVRVDGARWSQRSRHQAVVFPPSLFLRGVGEWVTVAASVSGEVHTFAAQYGDENYTYSLSPKDVGFNIDHGGVLRTDDGVSWGRYTLTVMVTDGEGSAAQTALRVDVVSLALRDAPLLSAFIGHPGSLHTFTARGGGTDKTYTLVAGNEADYFAIGMTSGVLSVLSSATVGVYTLWVEVADEQNNIAQARAVVDIVWLLSLEVPVLFAVSGVATEYTLAASGGIGMKTYILESSDESGFAIGMTSGVLSVPGLDEGAYTLTIKVMDEEEETVYAAATVRISAALVVLAEVSYTVIASVAMNVHTVLARDGIGDKTYTLVAGGDGYFAIDVTSGVLSLPAHTPVRVYTLSVVAVDAQDRRATAVVIADVRAELSWPVSLIYALTGVARNIYTVQAAGGIGAKTYTLLADESGSFVLATNDVLSVAANITVGSYTLSVAVEDARGHYLAGAMVVAIRPVVSLSAVPTLFIFAGAPRAVYTLSVSGGFGVKTYTLADAAFSVNVSLGVLSWNDDNNAVVGKVYTLSLAVRDESSRADVLATVAVSPSLVLSAPGAYLTAIAGLAGYELDTFVASGGFGAKTYTLEGNKAGFNIDAASGVLSAINATVGNYMLLVAVEDGATPSYRVSVAVAVQVVRNKIFVLGGIGDSRLNDVWSSWLDHSWALDQKDGSTTVSWTQREGHQVVVHNGRLYLLGGTGGGDKNDVWSSVDGKNWELETGNAGWPARDRFQAVSYGGRLYVLGGAATNLTNDVWSSVDGEEWTEETSSASWAGRRDHQVVSHNGRLYLLGGGLYGTGDEKDVWSSVDGKDWKLVNSNPGWDKRSGHQALSHNGSIYVLGGDIKNDVWSSPDGETWTKVKGGAQWSEREFHQAVSYQGLMYVLGGEDGTGYKNDVWSSADGKEWTEVDGVVWEARKSHQAVIFPPSLFLRGVGEWVTVAASVSGALHTFAAQYGDGNYTYSLSPEVPSFVLDEENGVLETDSPALGRYTLTVMVEDGEGSRAQTALRVVAVSLVLADVLLEMMSGYTGSLHIFAAAGGGDAKTYTIVAGNDGNFALDETTGVLSVLSSLAAGSYTLQVEVTDEDNNTARAQAVIEVAEFVLSSLLLEVSVLYAFIEEDKEFMLAASGGYWDKTYTLVADDTNHFAVTNGVLSLSAGLALGSYTLTIGVSDESETSTQAAVTVGISATLMVAERVSYTLIAGVAMNWHTVIASGGIGDKIYTMVAGHEDGYFDIDLTTGVLSLSVATPVGVYTLSVVAVDMEDHRATGVVIADLRPPLFLSVALIYALTGVARDLYTMQAEGDIGVKTYTLVADESGHFAVAKDGALSVAASITVAVYRLTVAVMDAHGHRLDREITVVIRPALFALLPSENELVVRLEKSRFYTFYHDMPYPYLSNYHELQTSGGRIFRVFGGFGQKVYTLVAGNDAFDLSMGDVNAGTNMQLYAGLLVWSGNAMITVGSYPLAIAVRDDSGQITMLVTMRVVDKLEIWPKNVRLTAIAKQSANIPLQTFTSSGGWGERKYRYRHHPTEGLLLKDKLDIDAKSGVLSVKADIPYIDKVVYNQGMNHRGFAVVSDLTLIDDVSALFVVTLVRNMMFVLGGSGGGALNDVWSSADGSNWQNRLNVTLWSARQGHQVVAYQERLYLLGGRDGDVTNDVWSSLNGRDWTLEQAEVGWAARADHQAVVHRGRLYVLGGEDDGGDELNDVWSSADGRSWSEETGSAAWSGRKDFQAVDNNDNNLDDVWSSADGRNWSEETGAAGWSARNNLQALSYRGNLYVLGGNDGSNLNDVWSSADGRRWSEETGSAGWSARVGHQAVSYNDRLLYVLGGDNLGDVWSSADGDSWTKVKGDNDAGWGKRGHHRAVVFPPPLFLAGVGEPINVLASEPGDIHTIVPQYGDGRYTYSWSPVDGFQFTEKVLVTDGGAEGGSHKTNVTALVLATDDNVVAGSYTLTVKVTDGDKSAAQTALRVEVLDWVLDDAPPLSLVAGEAQSVHIFVARGVGDVSYRIIDGNEDQYFTLHEITVTAETAAIDKGGVLSVVATVSVGIYTLAVEAIDDLNNNRATARATVEVTSFLSLAIPLLVAIAGTVTEHPLAASGGIGAKTYTLVASDTDYFAVAHNGVLSVSANLSVGFYTLTIAVTDESQETVRAAATVIVISSALTLANAPPSYVLVSNEVSLHTFVAAGGSGRNTYTMIAGNADYFVVNMSTGVLSLLLSATVGVYTLAIEVFDAGSQMAVVATALVAVGTSLSLSPVGDLVGVAGLTVAYELATFVASGGFGTKLYRLVAGHQTFLAMDEDSGVLSATEAPIGKYTLVVAARERDALGYHITVTATVRIERNLMWVLGGVDDGGESNDVWVSWNGADWRESTEDADWSVREGHQAVVHHDRLYVLGGRASTVVLNDVWSSVDGKNWSLEKANNNDGWTQRYGHQAVSYKGRIYVLGGDTDSRDNYISVKDDVWSSADGKSWRKEVTETIWSARYGHQAVVHKNRIYVLGGHDNYSTKKDVWWSVDGNNWSHEEDAGWVARYGHQAVSHHGTLYVMGRGPNPGNYVWSTEDATMWTEYEDPAQWDRRHSHQVLSHNGSIYVLGGDKSGSSSASYLGDVWSSVDGETWREEKADDDLGWSKRAHHQAVVFPPSLLLEWLDEPLRMTVGVADELKQLVARYGDGTYTYSLTPTVAGFSVDGGHLATDGYVKAGHYKLTVRVMDGDEMQAQMEVQVEVLPMLLAGARLLTVVVGEERAVHTYGSHGGHGGNTYTIIAGDDDGYFAIGMTTGVLSVFGQVTLGRYTMTIEVTDRLDNRDDAAVVVVVAPSLSLADAPWRYALADLSVAVSLHTFVGYDGVGDKTYTLAATADAGYFAIDADRGVLSLRADVPTPRDYTAWVVAVDSDPLPHQVTATMMVRVVRNMMLVLGGNDGTNENDVWSSVDGQHWPVMNRAPWAARRSHQVVAHDGRLVMLGGYDNENNKYYQDVWSSWDGVNWTQETNAAKWSARYGHQAVSHRGTLYVLGGHDGDFIHQDVWSSVDGGRSWSLEVSSADWGPRQNHQVVSHHGRLYVLGGIANNNYYNDVWSSVDGKNWSLEKGNNDDGWVKRYGHQAISDQGRLYVLGGYGGSVNNRSSRQDVWSSLDGKSWSQETAATWPSRYGHQVLSDQGRLYVLGGTGNSRRDDVWSWADGEDAWSPEPAAAWSKRSGHQAVVFPPSLLLVGVGERLSLTAGVAMPLVHKFQTQYGAGAHTYAIEPADAGFAIDHHGVLSTDGYARLGAHRLVVWVEDGEGRQAHTALWVEVVVPISLYLESVELTAVVGERVSLHSLAAINGSGGETYTIIAGNDEGYFALDRTTGLLSVLSPAEEGLHTLSVAVRDGAVTAQARVQVAVVSSLSWSTVSLLDAPEVISVAITTLMASGGIGAKTYTLVSGGAGYFVVEAQSGVLSVVGASVGLYTLSVAVRDRHGRAATMEVVVDVVPSLFLEVGSLLQARVGLSVALTTFVASGGSAGYMYKLVSGGGGYFVLGAKSGVLSVLGASAGLYTLWVGVEDDVSNKTTVAVLVRIVRSHIFVLGGYDDTVSYHDVWSSTEGQSWSPEGAGGWALRYGHQAVVHNGRLYVSGGKMGDDTYYNDVWSSADGQSWSRKTGSAAWSARHGHQMVSHQGLLYVLGGGAGDDNYYNDVWSSADGESWSPVKANDDQGWTKREYHQAVSHHGRLYVLGGRTTDEAIINENHRYRNDVWSSVDGVSWRQEFAHTDESDTWEGRAGHQAVSHNGTLYVLGGDASTGKGNYDFSNPKERNDVWYSVDGNSWERETKSAAWLRRVGHQALSYNGRLYVLGGYGWVADIDDEVPLQDVWSSVDGIDWTPETELAGWSARYLHQAVVFPLSLYLAAISERLTVAADVWGVAIRTFAAEHGDGNYTYSLLPEDADFEIGNHSGVLEVQGAAAGSHTLMVVVTDGDGSEVRTELRIDAVSMIVLAEVPLLSVFVEDAGALYTVFAQGGGNDKTYALVAGDDDGYFAIGAADGVLSVGSTAAVGVYTLLIDVGDEYDHMAQATAVVEVVELLSLKVSLLMAIAGMAIEYPLVASGGIGSKTYTLVAGNTDYFAVAKSGVLSLSASLSEGFYTLTLAVTDEAQKRAQVVATVAVSAVLTVAAVPSYTVVASVAMALHTVAASGGIGDKTYTLAAGGDGYFAIGVASGVLSLSVHTPAKVYILSVVVRDLWAQRATVVLSVDVRAELSLPGPLIYALTGVARNIYTMQAAGGIGAKTYTLVADESAHFAVATSGVLAVAADVAVGSYTLSVAVMDAQAGRGHRVVTVEMRPILYLLPGPRLFPFTGAGAYTLSASGGFGIKTYTLVVGHAAFSVAISDGVLSWDAAVGVYTLSLAVRDESGRAEMEVVVDVVPPLLLSPSASLLLTAIAKPSASAGIYRFRSSGGAKARTYKLLTGGDYFAIDAVSGWLSLGHEADLGKYTLSVAVQDGAIPPHQTVTDVEVAVVRNMMFVLGGYSNHNDAQEYSDVWSSADGQHWQNKLSPSGTFWSGRFSHQVLAYDGRLYLLGGSGGGRKNDVWSSWDGKTWAEVKADNSAGWTGRTGHQAVVYRQRMYVLGGSMNDETFNNDVWSSTNGETWREDTAMAGWAGRRDHQAVVHNGRIYVLGGRVGSGDGDVKNDVWSSADGRQWTEETSAAAWSARWGHQALSYQGRLYVLGGRSGDGGRKNDVWSSADGKTWRPETAATWAIRDSYAAVSYANRMYVLGGSGYTSDETFNNDVWSSADGNSWSEVKADNDAVGWSGRKSHAAVVFPPSLFLPGVGKGLRAIAGVTATIHTFTAQYGGGNYTYSSSPLGGGFTFANGVLKTDGSAEVGSYMLTVTVNDGDGSTAQTAVSVLVVTMVLADPPLLAAVVGRAMSLHTFIAMGGGGNEKTYTLVVGNPDYFTLDKDSGVLSVLATVPNGIYDLVVRAQDEIGNLAQVAAEVEVRLSLSLSGVSDLEAAVGKAGNMYTFVASGGLGAKTYTLVAGPQDYFRIDPTGVLSVVASVVVGRYTLSVAVRDESGQATAVAVVDVVPPVSLAESLTWAMRNWAVPVTLAASNGGKIKTYALMSGDEGYFKINANGVLTVVNREDIVVKTYALLVEVRDSTVPPSAVLGTVQVRVVRNEMFVLGGDDSGYRNDVWSSWSGQHWLLDKENKSSGEDRLWRQRKGHQAVAHNKRLYILGGHTSSGVSNDVWSSLDGEDWTLEKLNDHKKEWSLRWQHQAVSHGERMYVLGGMGVHGPFNDVWSSAAGKTWLREKTDTDNSSEGWSRRFGHRAISHNGRLYVLGGYDSSSDNYKNDVWSSADGKDWSLETQAAAWTSRADHQAVSHQGRIYVLGGGHYDRKQSKSRYHKDIWSSVDGKDWQWEGEASWPARKLHQALSHRGRIYVLGGNVEGNKKNDVWSWAVGEETWLREKADNNNVGWTRREFHQAVVFPPSLLLVGVGERLPVAANESGLHIHTVVAKYGDGNYTYSLSPAAGFGLDGNVLKTAGDEVAAGDYTLTVAVVDGEGSRAQTALRVAAVGIVLADAPMLTVVVGRALSVHTFMALGGLGTITYGLATEYQDYFGVAQDGVLSIFASAPLGVYTLEVSAGDEIGNIVQAMAVVDVVSSLSLAAVPTLEVSGREMMVYPLLASGGVGHKTYTIIAGDEDYFSLDATTGVFLVEDAPVGGYTLLLVVQDSDLPPNKMTVAVTVEVSLVDDDIFVLGGNSIIEVGNNTLLPTNDVWSWPATAAVQRPWTSLAISANWSPRKGHQVVSHNGNLYVLGGIDDNDVLLNDVWSSADGVSWTQVNSNVVYSARWLHQAVSHKGSLYVAGGLVGNDERANDVWSSADGVAWNRVTENAGWVARNYHQMVSHKGSLYVLGGQYKKEEFGKVVHKMANDVWSSADGAIWNEVLSQAKWAARDGHQAVSNNGRLYVLGGRDSDAPRNDVWSSADGQSWSLVKENNDDYWSKRIQFQAVSHDSWLYVMGGFKDGSSVHQTYVNDVWSSADGQNWTQRKTNGVTYWLGRKEFQAVVH